MNIDKNKISYPKQLIGGDRRDKGVIQIWFQSSDPQPAGQGAKYSTGLNGVYDLILTEIKLIHDHAPNQHFAIQMISDTFKLDKGAGASGNALGNGGDNDNVKFVHLDGQPDLLYPIKLRQTEIKNWVELEFRRLGSIQDDINTDSYNILLTIEYERL